VRVAAVTLLVASALVGCAGQWGSAPGTPALMTRSELADRRDPVSLVAYLGQPGADPAACEAPPGVNLPVVARELSAALVEGLTAGRIAPAVWRQCVDRLLSAMGGQSASALVEEVLAAHLRLLEHRRLEDEKLLQRRLIVMQGLYLERPPTAVLAPAFAQRLGRDLERLLARRRLGAFARARGSELAELLALERGVLAGRPVDLRLLDELLAASDDQTLEKCSVRLPDPSLRAEARRRRIRLRVRSSSDPEVRERAAEVEERMVRMGANPVSTAGRAIDRVWLEPGGPSPVSVLVRQDPTRDAAVLLQRRRDQANPSLLAPFPLRGSLRVALAGMPRPVTLCAPPEDLDPSPCLSPAEVRVGNPRVMLGRTGVLHFLDGLTGREMVQLARASTTFSVPVSVGGVAAEPLVWPLQFEAPRPLVLEGGDGPAVNVRVERTLAGRVVYRVDDRRQTRWVVVEPAHAAQFQIVSAGSTGFSGTSGSSGSDGSTGSSGSSASCPSSAGGDGGPGGDGSSGGDGSPGGRGGRGGDIHVEVICNPDSCRELMALVARTVESRGGRGGPGGSGGSGGRGGSGGSGGSGTTCWDNDGSLYSLSGGSSGRSGSDGSSGSSGPPGPDGEPGRVTIVVVDQ
jgi:hypothetical protein